MPTKVITKQEAVRAAYYIACVANGCGGFTARELPGDAEIMMDDQMSGKWRYTEHEIKHPRFSVSASRAKNQDGRIRDSKAEAHNLISFASYVLTYLSDMPEISGYVAKWADGMNDWASVKRTMSKEERSFLPEVEESADVTARMKAILRARVVAKLTKP